MQLLICNILPDFIPIFHLVYYFQIIFNFVIIKESINESTPKSPYVKNAFHFVTFTNDSAINTAVGIDILLNICTDFKQSESTT